MPESTQELLTGNKAWAADTLEKYPDFFKDMAEGQSPKYLWIGCADSRVPANQVTGVQPGSIFVQRNVANMVIQTDMNLLTSTLYAVNNLKVDHIIVCGHYGCGGVMAAMTDTSLGILDPWLGHIRDVRRLHEIELEEISDEKKRWDRFVELNVAEQVRNLSNIPFIHDEWVKRGAPHIHGWVFDLATGLIKDLGLSISPPNA